MKRQTRQLLLNLATGIAIAAAAAVVLLPGVASAAPARATQAVNVRAQPSTGAQIVNRLDPGETVEVTECASGWCFAIAEGRDGWVSAQYLSIGRPNNDNGNFLPPDFDDNDDFGGEACFFERSRFRGSDFCVASGDEIADLGGWRDRISSIENPDGLDVTVCTRTRFRGDCRTYTTGSRTLGGFDDAIKSLRVD